MDELWRILGGAALCYLGSWAVRFAVRAELHRAGIFRAARDLTAKETQEVMALAESGKPNAARRLIDRYRFDITQPE